MDKQELGYRGYKDYTSRFLRIYDAFVVGFMVPRVWRISPEPGLRLYRDHMGRRHLDVGPGTGYFIDRIERRADTELTLLDPNPDVLEFCRDVLAAWDPTLVQANALEPLPEIGPFDSAALMHVIHCLPGPMATKAAAIRHVAACLAPDGVLFGGTVLGMSADHTLPARVFLRFANRQGGFSNLHDDLDGLRRVLEDSFEEVEFTEPGGSIAYFVARRPRRD